MTKFLCASLLFATILVSSSWEYKGSTTAAVTLTGGMFLASQTEDVIVKVPRSKCPECKKTGKIPTGDWNNPFVPCDNCYDDSEQGDMNPSEVTHDPIIIKGPDSKKNKCVNPYCPCEDCDCDKCGCLPTIKSL